MGHGSRLLRLVRTISGRIAPGPNSRVMTGLLLISVVDYGERTLVGALGPTLQSVFHINNAQLGLLSSASGVVGALATIPLGILADRVNRTALLAISLILWAAAVGVVGAAVSFAMLFGARMLLGVVSAATGPTTPSLVGDIVPATRRGRALGVINSGQLLGDGVGYVLPVLVTALLSWRFDFWLLALAGAALSVLFWRLPEPRRTGAAGPPDRNDGNGNNDSAAGDNRDGQGQGQGRASRVQQLVRDKGVAPSSRAILREDPGKMSLWAAARYVLRVRTDVIVLVARSIGDYFLSGITTFAVIFATAQYGLSQSGADLAILTLGVGALAGTLLVGRLSDVLLDRGRLNSRILLGALGYILAPLPLFFAFRTHALLIALPLFALGAFFLAGAGPPLDAARIDVLAPRLRGRAESIRQVLRTAAEAGAPVLIGVLSGVLAGGGHAGLQAAFIVTLPALLVTGLVLLFALRAYAPDVAAVLAETDGKRPAMGRPGATGAKS